MSCPQCGFANPPNSARCQKCGVGLAVAPQQQQHATPQQQQYATPPQQQQPVQVIVQQQPVVQPPPQAPVFTVAPKSKSTAALLCFFLGVWGIHNFYLGYIGRGIAQIILTVTWFGMIISIPWVLIEFIMILTGNIKDSRGQPLA